MQKLVAALLAAASCAGIAQAQTSPPIVVEGILTLDEALARAGVSSPSNEAANAGLSAAEAGRAVAGLRPNPSVSAATENVVGSGPYRGFDQAETTVSFSLPVELGGKRNARIGVAEARIDRAQLETAISQADVRLRVTQAYIEAAANERRLAVARDQLTIAGEAQRVARLRVTAGENPPIDEQRTSVALINAQAALEQAERAKSVSRTNLALLVDQPIVGALDQSWFDQLTPYGPQTAPSAEGTLAVAAARADLRIAAANVRFARSQRTPDFSISAGTRRLSATGDTAALVGLSVALPFLNNGRAAVLQASAEQSQADARRRAAMLEASQDIANAVHDRDNAAAGARSSVPAIAAATEAARIARVGYRQGKFDQLVLLDAERTLAQTRSSAIDALAQYHDAEARLARLTAPAPALPGDNR